MCAAQIADSNDDPPQPVDSDEDAVETETNFRPEFIAMPGEGASEKELREVSFLFRRVHGLIYIFRL